MITLKDIAKEAGVSVMTVSRVINGNKSKVSKATAKKIMNIIKKNNYVPNSYARNLSSKISNMISIIIRGNATYFNDAYISTLFGNIIENIQCKNYHTMINFITDYQDITKHLRSWSSSGAIFLGTFDRDILKIQEDNHIPLVFIDSYNSKRQFTNVGIDDYKGGVLAAKYFIEHGHRNFAFVGTSIDLSGVVKHRLKGFKDTITNYGMTLPSTNIFSIDKNENIVDDITNSKKGITAIFATSDRIAIRLIDKMKCKGFHIPKDYSIIGFDNIPMSYYITPKLTTISQDISYKARLASNILFKHMNDHNLPPENVILDVKLIERDSVRTI